MNFDTRLGAYVVIVDDGRILLSLWKGVTKPNFRTGPKWTLPGGGVELGERIEDGAVREVREETGYDVELTGLLGVDSYAIPTAERMGEHTRPLQAARVIYSGRVIGGELTHEADGSSEQAAWLPIDGPYPAPHAELLNIGLRLWRAQRLTDPDGRLMGTSG